MQYTSLNTTLAGMLSSLFVIVLALWGPTWLHNGFAHASSNATSTSLTMTAIVGKDNQSAFECWALTPALSVSTTSGVVGASSFNNLGNVTNPGYVYFPNNLDGGLHNAPRPQYVVFLTGGGIVSLPKDSSSNSSAALVISRKHTIKAGDIIIAADISSVSALGHESVWEAGTSAIQLPFADGIPPEHVVLHDKPCKAQLQ